ncbi:MAG: hypothetical protein KGL39_10050 [Patescibacteria group bacterium]|nr:hypothetical protein [Patescibacteria group bacterium]
MNSLPTRDILKPATTYSELKSKLDSNHAICESIQAEIDKLNHDEIWVVFFKDKANAPNCFTSEKEAMAYCSSIRKSVVRYVLPIKKGEAELPKEN